MLLHFLACLVLVTTVSCGYLGDSGLHFNQDTAYAPHYDNYEPRDYHFNYAVSDPHTGDHKSQWEVRDKGVVRGGYSLLEPDGTTRIVEYIADHDGFRAIVKKIGDSIHPDHVETHGVAEPVAVPEQNHYHTYDGQVDNYANVLSAGLQHPEPESYVQPIEIPQTVSVHGYQPVPLPYQQLHAYSEVNHNQAPQQQYVVPSHGHHQVPHNEYVVPSQGHSQVPQHEYVVAGYEQPAQEYSVPNYEVKQIQYPVPPQAYGNQYHQHVAAELPQLESDVHVSQQYHGLTGNPEDDSRYTNYDETHDGGDYYHGGYSEKVAKVIAAPLKGESSIKPQKSAPQQFVIYYPGPESAGH